jgi:hypothetical protein
MLRMSGRAQSFGMAAAADVRLARRTVEAPWLPAGSDAEVWVGDIDSLPEPSIIVRLLLTRRSGPGPTRFFCVPSAKGLDLPTRFLDRDTERPDPSRGVARLVTAVLGPGAVTTHCVGYVRNVVPVPDADYPHPTPWAHVPVVVVDGAPEPAVDGEWVDLESARDQLSTRHWWPIVEHHLGAAGQPAERP